MSFRPRLRASPPLYSEPRVHLPETVIIATDEVASAENDAYLSIFSNESMDDPEAAHWFREWLVQEVRIMGKPARIKDFDDMLRKLYDMMPPEEVLRRTGLKPRDLLSTLTLEERLEGLSSRERLEGLSSEELKALRDEVTRRLQRTG